MERNLNIDLAKCIACIGVVGLHGIGMANYTLYYLCSFAVPMFFMINGYLMFQKESVGFKYAGKKILSYLKLILCWNILLIIPVMVLRHKLINPLTECIRSIMQQGYLWHFWFFGSMMVLLILLPLIHKVLKGKTALNAVVVAILFFICLGVTISSWRAEYPNQAFVPQFLRIWMYGFYYLAGALIAQSGLIEKIKVGTSKVPIYVTGTLTIILAYVSNMGQKHLGNYRYHNRLAEYFYDDRGALVETVDMVPGGVLLNIPVGQWHSLKSLESGTVLLECKDGPYEPLGPEDILAI